MKLNLRVVVAACAAIAFAGSASAVSAPGQSLGTLSASPALLGSVTAAAAPGSFLDSYSFVLNDVSDVTGSVGTFFGSYSFSKVYLDGVDVAPVATTTGYGFSFSSISSGTHVLKIEGTVAAGFNGYTGAVTATPAVPEPESLALLLGGVGIVGLVARRRRVI